MPAKGAKRFLQSSPHSRHSTAQVAPTQSPLRPAPGPAQSHWFPDIPYSQKIQLWDAVHPGAKERMSLKNKTGSAEEMHFPRIQGQSLLPTAHSRQTTQPSSETWRPRELPCLETGMEVQSSRVVKTAQSTRNRFGERNADDTDLHEVSP